jgi:hypothetical protein
LDIGNPPIHNAEQATSSKNNRLLDEEESSAEARAGTDTIDDRGRSCPTLCRDMDDLDRETVHFCSLFLTSTENYDSVNLFVFLRMKKWTKNWSIFFILEAEC